VRLITILRNNWFNRNHLDITEQKRAGRTVVFTVINCRKNINAVVVSDKQGKVEWANASLP
jgi:hypothetical protein